MADFTVRFYSECLNRPTTFKYHLAIVCPSGENGFWLNGLSTGHVYQESHGGHDMEFWAEYVKKYIEMVWGR